MKPGLTLAIAAAWLSPAAAARAEGPPAAGDPAAGTTVEHTAKDTAGAPLPGDESGRLDRVDGGDGVARIIARDVLWIPRAVLELAYLPVYLAVLATDRYHLDKLYYKIFFNANHTLGLVPTAVYVSGFGLSVGARLSELNLLGHHERLSVQATTGIVSGDTYREGAVVETHSGDYLGTHLELGFIADFDRRPADPFYGLGNGNQTHVPPAAPIDPRVDDTAFEVYNRYREARVGGRIDVKPTLTSHLELNGALTQIDYDQSTTGTRLSEVYVPADIPGFLSGVRHAYGEVVLIWDTRRNATPWEPLQEYTRGGLIAAYAGRVHRLDAGVDYWRYGGELQRFFRLGRGPRALLVRARAAGVSGPPDIVPFTELPTLGGGDFLRGYSFDRFRDRAAAFGTIQYEWDISHFVGAYLFTDIGRVYNSFAQLTVDDLRVGYGVGLEIHGDTGFLMTASIASSIDGGIFTTLAFNQAIDGETRWR